MSDLELAKEIIESFLKRRFEKTTSAQYWSAIINLDDEIEDHLKMMKDVFEGALKEFYEKRNTDL